MIEVVSQIRMARMLLPGLAVALSLCLTSAAALPAPQDHPGQQEHNMELGNIDNVGYIMDLLYSAQTIALLRQMFVCPSVFPRALFLHLSNSL